MKKLLVINDYSLAKSWDDARHGISPNHFLYGVDELSRWGYEIIDISRSCSSLLTALDRALVRAPLHVGSLDRQLGALKYLRSADAIYSPCHLRIHALCHMRALGLLDTPIVWLAHHPVERGRLAALRRPMLRHVLAGSSAVPSLSCQVAAGINAIAPVSVAEPILWGPDASFYPPAEYPGVGVIAAGRTGRDFVTFARAAIRSGTPATILCPKATAAALAPEVEAKGVRVIAPEVFLEYRESAKLFASARALAVPMFAQDSLCGLTSLMDALGAGKPLIVTRNPYLDLEIEALGIGRWVDAGDEDGWVRALRFFEEHPREAEDMGRRARALVEGGMNAHAFAGRIAQVLLAAA